MQAGYAMPPWLEDADLILALDTMLPWVRNRVDPPENCRVVMAAAEPQFARTSLQAHPCDLALAGTPTTILENLSAALAERRKENAERIKSRRRRVGRRIRQLRESARRAAEAGNDSPVGQAWVGHCLSEVMGDEVSIFSELGVAAPNLDLRAPNQLHQVPLAGGLGWAFPAALGAQLADRDRLCVATMGDGCYLFSNPVSNHHIAEALELPVLCIVLNNRVWNAVRFSVVSVYPEGHAAKMDPVPVTSLSPSPDIVKIARASRAWARRVEHGRDLPRALKEAVRVIRREKRHAVIEVVTPAHHLTA